MRIRHPSLALLIASLAILCLARFPAQNAGPTPAKKDPSTLKARDQHQDLLVAADPWLKPEDYKSRFGKKTPFDAGIIAIDVYFRNDGVQPVRLNLDTIRLTISLPNTPDQELSPLRPQAVAEAVYTTDPLKPRGRRLPLPLPSSDKGKQMQELASSLRGVQLSTDLIPPKLVVNGLLYFDLGGHFNYISFARLYIPDLSRMGTDQPMFFFDVRFGPPPDN